MRRNNDNLTVTRNALAAASRPSRRTARQAAAGNIEGRSKVSRNLECRAARAAGFRWTYLRQFSGHRGNGGGLDFTAVVSAPGQTAPASALPSGDSRVVDARMCRRASRAGGKCHSGAYAKFAAGVSDRVRKGFRRSRTATGRSPKPGLKRRSSRPSNAGLKRLIELCDAAPARTGKVATCGRATVADARSGGLEHDFSSTQALDDKQAMDALFGLP